MHVTVTLCIETCNLMTLQTLPILCIHGYQSSEGSTECFPCPAGFGCPLTSDPTLNFACTSGLYSPEGVSLCLSCPAGSACPNTSVSVICESGTFSLEGYTECEPCPAGWACPYTDGHGNAPCTQVSHVYLLHCTSFLSVCIQCEMNTATYVRIYV